MALILVIEDERQVMEVTTELLQSLGHRVLQAETGAEALRILSTSSGRRVDLALLDLSLPDCEGLELLPELRGRLAGLKIIVCSGDTSAVAELEGLSPPVGFLGKPFTMLHLEEMVEKSLASF